MHIFKVKPPLVYSRVDKLINRSVIRKSLLNEKILKGVKGLSNIKEDRKSNQWINKTIINIKLLITLLSFLMIIKYSWMSFSMLDFEFFDV